MSASSHFIPNFFILGAAKCGTTTLYQYLQRHDHICMSNPKEPFFFEAFYKEGLQYYQEKYFSHWKGEPVIGEARHRNLYLPYIPQRIYSINKEPKLLVTLRNPVLRAYSHWYHNASRNSENLSFSKAIKVDWQRIKEGLDCSTEPEIQEHIRNLARKKPNSVIGLGLYRTYIDSGYYSIQIERYLKYFDRSNIMVVIFEEFVKNPILILNKICEFLGIDEYTEWSRLNEDHIYKNLYKKEELDFSSLSAKVVYRMNKFSKKIFGNQCKLFNPYDTLQNTKTMKWLYQHYMPYNHELEQLINKDLTDWR